MYDLRLEHFTQPLSPSLSLASQLYYTNKEIQSLENIRRGFQDQIKFLEFHLNKLNEKSKTIQIAMFEDAGRITRFTDAGTVRKIKISTKPQPADLSINDIETYVSGLTDADRGIFVANLLSRI